MVTQRLLTALPSGNDNSILPFSHTKNTFSSVSTQSASPPASVGLCNFLSECLPACLDVCLPTCFTSASAVRPQRDVILFLRGHNDPLCSPCQSSCLAFLCYSTTSPHFPRRLFCIHFIWCLTPFSFTSHPSHSCAPSLQAGRKAGWRLLCPCQS